MVAQRMWNRPSGGRGLTEGFGGGGGGSGFAPSPGRGGMRPPGAPPRVPVASPAANPPMGMPRGFRFPPKRHGGWKPSKQLLDEIGKKLNGWFNFKKWAEEYGGHLPGEQFGPEWVKTFPSDYHSNFALVLLNPVQTLCFGSALPQYGIRNVSYVPSTACVNASWSFGTFELAAAQPAAAVVGGHVLLPHTGPVFTKQPAKIWRRTNAGTTVNYVVAPQPQFWPDAWPDPLAEPGLQVKERPDYGISTLNPPWAQPAIDVDPGGKPNVPTIHKPVPPVPPDRERKPFPRGIPYGEFGKWYGRATEANDLMDCMAEAAGMPQLKGSPQDRARALWDRYNDPELPAPDGNVFAACMARESAQDAAIGRLSKGTTRALNRSPYASQRPGGYRGGGWGTRMHNS